MPEWITGKKIVAETSKTFYSESQQIPGLPSQEYWLRVIPTTSTLVYMCMCVCVRNMQMYARVTGKDGSKGETGMNGNYINSM